MAKVNFYQTYYPGFISTVQDSQFVLKKSYWPWGKKKKSLVAVNVENGKKPVPRTVDHEVDIRKISDKKLSEALLCLKEEKAELESKSSLTSDESDRLTEIDQSITKINEEFNVRKAKVIVGFETFEIHYLDDTALTQLENNITAIKNDPNTNPTQKNSCDVALTKIAAERANRAVPELKIKYKETIEEILDRTQRYLKAKKGIRITWPWQKRINIHGTPFTIDTEPLEMMAVSVPTEGPKKYFPDVDFRVYISNIDKFNEAFNARGLNMKKLKDEVGAELNKLLKQHIHDAEEYIEDIAKVGKIVNIPAGAASFQSYFELIVRRNKEQIANLLQSFGLSLDIITTKIDRVEEASAESKKHYLLAAGILTEEQMRAATADVQIGGVPGAQNGGPTAANPGGIPKPAPAIRTLTADELNKAITFTNDYLKQDASIDLERLILKVARDMEVIIGDIPVSEIAKQIRGAVTGAKSSYTPAPTPTVRTLTAGELNSAISFANTYLKQDPTIDLEMLILKVARDLHDTRVRDIEVPDISDQIRITVTNAKTSYRPAPAPTPTPTVRTLTTEEINDAVRMAQGKINNNPNIDVTALLTSVARDMEIIIGDMTASEIAKQIKTVIVAVRASYTVPAPVPASAPAPAPAPASAPAPTPTPVPAPEPVTDEDKIRSFIQSMNIDINSLSEEDIEQRIAPFVSFQTKIDFAKVVEVLKRLANPLAAYQTILDSDPVIPTLNDAEAKKSYISYLLCTKCGVKQDDAPALAEQYIQSIQNNGPTV